MSAFTGRSPQLFITTYTATHRPDMTGIRTVLIHDAGANAFSGASGELLDGTMGSDDTTEDAWVNSALGNSFTDENSCGNMSAVTSGITKNTPAPTWSRNIAAVRFIRMFETHLPASFIFPGLAGIYQVPVTS